MVKVSWYCMHKDYKKDKKCPIDRMGDGLETLCDWCGYGHYCINEFKCEMCDEKFVCKYYEMKVRCE